MPLIRRIPLLRQYLPLRSYTSIPTPPRPVSHEQPTSRSPEPLQQSPNVPSTWSTSQNPKPHAYNNARFEQVNLSMQPNSRSGMGMIAEDPVRLVLGRKATCDGGEFVLREFIILVDLSLMDVWG